jgi:hypothetical protein
LNKFPIFAALGIPEVWRHDGARVAIFALIDNDYVERAESVVLPKVASATLTELIDASRRLKRPTRPATPWFRRSGFPRCLRIDGSPKATPQATTILDNVCSAA